MPKQGIYKETAFRKLKAGGDKLAAAVVSTLGPRGKNVIVETGALPIVTKDGVSVAKYFDLEDPVERMGVQLVRQAALRTNEQVGDGTSTSILLTREIMDACERELEAHPEKNVFELAKEMREYGEVICRDLDEQVVKIESLDELVNVATISANNDLETGRLVAELVYKVGKDGVITVEESSKATTETEHVEGTQVSSGYASPYMATNERGECVLNDVPVLITDRRISSTADILPILKQLKESGKNNVVIVADDVEGDALNMLVVNKLQGIFTALAVKANWHGTYRNESLKDLAATLGATFISDETGRKLDSIKLADLGSVKKVIATKDKTTFIGGAARTEEVEARILELREQIAVEDNDFDKEKKQERLARLTSGVALIRVGGYTEVEMKEKKYLIEDAVCATRAALLHGVLPGGGTALVRAVVGRNQTHFLDTCLMEPLRLIAGSKKKAGEVFDALVSGGSKRPGYDAKKEVHVEDMVAAGVVDPLSVVKNSLMNAISAATTFLTTDAVLFDKPVKK